MLTHADARKLGRRMPPIACWNGTGTGEVQEGYG